VNKQLPDRPPPRTPIELLGAIVDCDARTCRALAMIVALAVLVLAAGPAVTAAAAALAAVSRRSRGQ
jgi:hypothetical protein